MYAPPTEAEASMPPYSGMPPYEVDAMFAAMPPPMEQMGPGPVEAVALRPRLRPRPSLAPASPLPSPSP